MQHPRQQLPRKEDVCVLLLHMPVQWGYTFSYLAALRGKSGSLEKGTGFTSTYILNEEK